ncbi:MAG TPA: hypothetical protein VFX51_28975, partial [Solirubrobacteraceae bacterium]|nr:hypothetical protein [Solirubrobacteraceae bacterium]
MASLRARLLVALLALTALGLLLLGGITYVEQRSFELDRVDAQVRSAPPAVVAALHEQGIGEEPREEIGGRRPPPGEEPGSGLPV